MAAIAAVPALPPTLRKISVTTPSPRFRLVLYPEARGGYTSLFYTGFEDLRGRGLVTLSYASRLPHRAPRSDLPVALFSVERHPGTPTDRRNRPIYVCCDVVDSGPIACSDDRAFADVYFKRSFSAIELATAPHEHVNVLPLGLHYACEHPDESSWHRLVREASHLRIQTLPSWRLPQAAARATRAGLSRTPWLGARLRRHPLTSELESAPARPCSPSIYFRSRVYDRPEAAATNACRVSVIRTLRKAFGSAFVGGLRHTPFAEASYPDCLFRGVDGQRGHLVESRRHAINVNVDGLHDSISWKLPEMMAGSRCIVTQRLKFEVAHPLVEGRHYLSFDEPEECVEQCRRLLGSPEEAQSMRNSNWSYYQQYLHPGALALDLIERALAHATH